MKKKYVKIMKKKYIQLTVNFILLGLFTTLMISNALLYPTRNKMTSDCPKKLKGMLYISDEPTNVTYPQTCFTLVPL